MLVSVRICLILESTIRDKFCLCTVITVAHRLHTIIDSDRILVMKDGSVAEFDQPHILLSKSDSILRSMVDQTDANAPVLLRLAKESYDQKQSAVG
jgi:ATP-binding cassette subfamily C (CFTR/MRP) protein 4